MIQQQKLTLTLNCPGESYITAWKTLDDSDILKSALSTCWSCPAQHVHHRQKSLCGCCSFQKPCVSMAAIYAHFSPTKLHSFGLHHHIHPCGYKCTNKTHKPVFTVSTNTYRNWQWRSWKRLLSSEDTEGACCLFVSSSALFPLGTVM